MKKNNLEDAHDKLLGSFTIEGYTLEASASEGNFGDIQSALASSSDAETAVQEFLKQTKSRYGFGAASSLFAAFVSAL